MCLLVLGSVAGVAECLAALLEEFAEERLLPRVASVMDFEIFKPGETPTAVTLLTSEWALSCVNPA